MSIERSQSSRNENASREAENTRDRPRDKLHDKQPDPEQVDRFRALMQNRGDKKEQLGSGSHDQTRRSDVSLVKDDALNANLSDQTIEYEHAQRDSSDDNSEQFNGGESLKPAELAALYQAQIMTREAPIAPPSAALAPQINPRALADLLERHVRQLAASSSAAGNRDGQMLLRLADSTLPGTDLMLSRTETGWKLRADVRSRSSYDAIQQAAPKLAERFASRDLGVLEIDSFLLQ